MSLDKTEIDKIAWLARLNIDEADIPGYTEDLSNILDLVEKMNEIETASLAPMAHPLEIKARLRPDEITETNQRDKFQKLAPATEDGHYLVPRVID